MEQARLDPALVFVDYPSQMHTTRHDDDLVRAVAETHEASMSYYGAAAFGDTHTLDQLSGRFMLWKGGKVS